MSGLRFVMEATTTATRGHQRVRWTAQNGHPGYCRCWHTSPEAALRCYRGETACRCRCTSCTLARAGIAGGGHCGQGSCPIRPAAA